MNDLTHYTENELSLMVLNDELLYNIALNSVSELLDMIKDIFIYTDEQLAVLEKDLDCMLED